MRTIASAALALALACGAAACTEGPAKGDVRVEPVTITIDAGAVGQKIEEGARELGRDLEEGAKELGRDVREGAGRAIEQAGRDLRPRDRPDAGSGKSQ
jgi:hypothetical protein